MEKVEKDEVVKPEALPPTSDAAAQHSFRVYSQIQEWLGNLLSPTDWGWKVADGCCVPILITQPAAPDYLLKYVCCGCKENGCDTNRCSCKKYGLSCTLSCQKCNGVSCKNAQILQVTDENDEDDY